MRPLIVTGCGRSGTAWAAAVVTACGWGCSHERQFPSAGTGRPLSFPEGYAEASATAVVYLDLVPRPYVVHLVRHPLDVVSSAVERGIFTGAMTPGARFAAIAGTLSESGREVTTARAETALSVIPMANATATRPHRLGWNDLPDVLADRACAQAVAYGFVP